MEREGKGVRGRGGRERERRRDISRERERERLLSLNTTIASIGDVCNDESSQICPFLAVRTQFERVHHQNRRLSSHSYSHESVIFLD